MVQEHEELLMITCDHMRGGMTLMPIADVFKTSEAQAAVALSRLTVLANPIQPMVPRKPIILRRTGALGNQSLVA